MLVCCSLHIHIWILCVPLKDCESGPGIIDGLTFLPFSNEIYGVLFCFGIVRTLFPVERKDLIHFRYSFLFSPGLTERKKDLVPYSFFTNKKTSV